MEVLEVTVVTENTENNENTENAHIKIVNRKWLKNGNRYAIFDDTLLKAKVFLYRMAFIPSKSDDK